MANWADIIREAFPEVDEIRDVARGPQGPAGDTGAWDESTPYILGQLVTQQKAGIWYTWTSLINGNTGNDPATDDGTNWTGGDCQDAVCIQFDISEAAPTHSEGQIHWNSDDKTLDVDSDVVNTSMQVGQEMWVRATNKTAGQLNNGAVVYVDGAQGNRPTVALARADAHSTDNVIGVMTHDLAINDTGYMTAFGLVRDIDTTGTDESEVWAAGDQLYLSATTAGALTKTSPASPNHGVEVAIVLLAHASNGVLFIHPQHDPEQFLLHTGAVVTNLSETLSSQTANGNIVFNANLGNVHEVILNGNMSDQTFSNFPVSGVSYTMAIKLKQDGDGNRTATWNAVVDWGDDGAPTISTTANLWDWVFLTTTDGGVSLEGTYRTGFGA